MNSRTLALFLGACVGAMLAVGLLLSPFLRGSLASAQSGATPRQYRECIATSTWGVSGRELNNGELPRASAHIPAGWTPIGGAGTAGNDPFIILCR